MLLDEKHSEEQIRYLHHRPEVSGIAILSRKKLYVLVKLDKYRKVQAVEGTVASLLLELQCVCQEHLFSALLFSTLTPLQAQEPDDRLLSLLGVQHQGQVELAFKTFLEFLRVIHVPEQEFLRLEETVGLGHEPALMLREYLKGQHVFAAVNLVLQAGTTVMDLAWVRNPIT